MQRTRYLAIKSLFDNFEYNQQVSSSSKVELTEEPTDEKDWEELAAGNPKFFIADSYGKIRKKQNFIITSFYIEKLNPNLREILIDFIVFLMKDGHPIYVSQKEGLKKVEDIFSISKELNHLVRINSKAAIEIASKYNLKKRTLQILNTEFLQKLLREVCLPELKNSLCDCDFPVTHPRYLKGEMKSLEACLDAKDQFTAQTGDFEYDDQANCFVLQDVETRIGTLIIQHELSEADAELIYRAFPNLNSIIVECDLFKVGKFNDGYPHIFRLISCYSNLSRLIFKNVDMLSSRSDDEHLSFECLYKIKNLTEFGMYHSGFSYALINHFLTQNMKLEKLECQFENSYPSKLNCNFLNLENENHFLKLTFFSLKMFFQKISKDDNEHWEFGRESLPNFFKAAPNIRQAIFYETHIFHDAYDDECFLFNKNMTELSMLYCSCNSSNLIEILVSSPQLVYCKVASRNLNYIILDNLNYLLNPMNQMSSLHLEFQDEQISLENISKFLTFFPNLMDLILNIYSDENIDSNGCLILGSSYSINFPKLYSFCSNHDYFNFLKIETNTLCHLSLSGGNSANNIIINNPGLEKILISGWDDLEILSKNHFKNLYYLSISDILPSKNKNFSINDCLFSSTFINKTLLKLALSLNNRFYFLKLIGFNHVAISSSLDYLTEVHSNEMTAIQSIARHAKELNSVFLATYKDGSPLDLFSESYIPQVKSVSIFALCLDSNSNNWINKVNFFLNSFSNAKELFLMYDQLSLVKVPSNYSQVHIESPYVNLEMIQDMIQPTWNDVFLKCLMENLKAEISDFNKLQKRYPYINFNFEFLKRAQGAITEKNYTPSHQSITLIQPNHFALLEPPDPTTTHILKRRFVSKGNQPDPSLREEIGMLEIYRPTPGSDQPWQVYYPADSDLEDYHPEILTEFDPDYKTGDHYYFGTEEYIDIQPNALIFLPLPSTHSPLSKLEAFWSDSKVEFIFKRHKTFGFFYFIFTGSQAISLRVGYTLLTPPYYLDLPLVSEEEIINSFEMISKSRFNSSGTLVYQGAFYQMLARDYSSLSDRQYSILAIVYAAMRFCDFPNNNPPISQSIQLHYSDKFNFLLQNRPGQARCIFRAELYAAICESLGIPALLSTNPLHAFSIQFNASYGFLKIDLGGAPCAEPIINFSLETEIKLHAIKIQKMRQNEEARVIESYKNLEEEKIFNENQIQVERQDRIEPNDIQELLQMLFFSGLKNQLVVLNNDRCVHTVHDGLCKQFKADGSVFFFTPNLDAMSLFSKKTQAGKTENVDSPLASFLKKSSEKPLYWFINWSSPNQEHAEYQSIFGAKSQRLGDLVIPNHVRIIILMDKETVEKIDADFKNDMNDIYDASYVSELPKLMLEDIETSPQDIVIYEQREWEKILKGYPTLGNNGVVEIKYGILPALEQTQSDAKLVLRNPPLEMDSFQYFMREYLSNDVTSIQFLLYNQLSNCSFFFNGKNFETKRPTIIYSTLQIKPYPYLGCSSKNRQYTLILNSRNFSQFFEKNYITEKGFEKKSLLELLMGRSILLKVTETLSEGEWFKFLKEAENHCLDLEFEVTPDVQIPSILPLKTEARLLTSIDQNRICAYVTNDIDFVLDEIKQLHPMAEMIPIGPKTGFNAQFIKIEKDENDKFISKKTNLFEYFKKEVPLIFVGEFSQAFVKKIESAFTENPYWVINGERHDIKSNLFFVTPFAKTFSCIQYQEKMYNPEKDFKKLPVELEIKLRETYEKLKITPSHAHFKRMLHASEAVMKVSCDKLIERLECSRGISNPQKIQIPTEPGVVLEVAKEHPFISFMSETGCGKSYFMEEEFPKYNKDIEVFHEENRLMPYLESTNGKSIHFIDEANTENNDHWRLLNRARGENVMWECGMKYDLGNKMIFLAMNRHDYGDNRKAPSILEYYPHYFEFIPKPIDAILLRMLNVFRNPEKLLELINQYYEKLQREKVPVSKRNKLNICMVAATLKKYLNFRLPEEGIVQYAILFELNTIIFDREKTKLLRTELKEMISWCYSGAVVKEAIKNEIEKIINSDFQHIWIARDKKIALTLWVLLMVRKERMNGWYEQKQGISSMILEGLSDHGLAELMEALFRVFNLDPAFISLANPNEAQEKIEKHFNQADILFFPSYHVGGNEKLKNCYTSGVTQKKKSPEQKGSLIIATQKPMTSSDAEALSDAQVNRSATIKLKEYSEKDLQLLLTKKYLLDPERALQQIEEFKISKRYAKNKNLTHKLTYQGLFKKAESKQKAMAEQSSSSRYSELNEDLVKQASAGMKRSFEDFSMQ